MSIVPRGMSVQEAYKLYRGQSLVVNRRYQRKLVWTDAEKQNLINSILKAYPIPLFLLAQRVGEGQKYEIIDGMQRLNAIFSYLETQFAVDEKFFDINQLARAKQAADEGLFKEASTTLPRLARNRCADLLDYQLAVTIYPAKTETEITEVFGRINSNGKLLSDQDRRQAGVITPFAELVRKLASELRGDASQEILDLVDMPEISIETGRLTQGYGITAEETFWVKQGILRVGQLRDSEDEQMLVDIASSILFHKPLAFSGVMMDRLYDAADDEHRTLENNLSAYGSDRLSREIKTTTSVMLEIIESVSIEVNCLKKYMNPSAGGNPIKTPFYAFFMALFDLIIIQQKTPTDPPGILNSLKGVASRLEPGRARLNPEERQQNINVVKGLINQFFVTKNPPLLGHGPGLALDFENALRRSSVETTRYEFKQGILRLDSKRDQDHDFPRRLVEHLCGLANAGPDADGYLFIGVADNDTDSKRVESLDKIRAIKVGQTFVVGVDREAKLLKLSMERYVGKIMDWIRNSDLSEPLRSDVLRNCDTVSYRGNSIIRLRIPAQSQVSYVKDEAFCRQNSSTVKATAPMMVAIANAFSNKTAAALSR